jgi:hypothetical protein
MENDVAVVQRKARTPFSVAKTKHRRGKAVPRGFVNEAMIRFMTVKEDYR